jgi:hypothetical protein
MLIHNEPTVSKIGRSKLTQYPCCGHQISAVGRTWVRDNVDDGWCCVGRLSGVGCCWLWSVGFVELTIARNRRCENKVWVAPFLVKLEGVLGSIEKNSRKIIGNDC